MEDKVKKTALTNTWRKNNRSVTARAEELNKSPTTRCAGKANKTAEVIKTAH